MSHVTETEFTWHADTLSKLSVAQSLQNVCIRFRKPYQWNFNEPIQIHMIGHIEGTLCK